MASSSSGGSGSGGPSGGSRPPSSGGYGSGQPPRGGSGGSGQSPYSSSGQGRPTRPTAPAGQERMVSYQREEERYWTDYLRVALPVVGLLLMLGLFWYWAQSLIGDDDDDPPATTVSEIIAEPTPEPTEPQQVAISPTPGGDEAAQTDGQGDATEPPADNQGTGQETNQQAGQESDPDTENGTDQTDPDQETDAEDGFQPDDIVVVTEVGDELNMRSEPTIGENVLETLPVGTELQIIDGPQEAEGYIWYQVANDETGNDGWIVDDAGDGPTIELSS